MTCLICESEIETYQLRHSNGEGDYHMICEFNQIRERLGMPLYQEIRKVKFYSGFDDAPTTRSGKNKIYNMSTAH